MSDAPASTSFLPPAGRTEQALASHPSPVLAWAWFLAKNVIGWILILGAFPLGALIPGPGGIPLFLIGFGLITFPGKRRLTARWLRGIAIRPGSSLYRFIVVLLALLVPAAILLWVIEGNWVHPGALRAVRGSVAWGYFAVVVVLIGIGLMSQGLVNRLIAKIPVMRRKVRPWLRKKGIDLLPPRRRQRIVLTNGHVARPSNPEILEIHERHMTRLRGVWGLSKPWIKRILGLAVTVTIFVLISRPIIRRWDAISGRIATISWGRFALAASIFAVFLFVFRAMTWRRILKRFGHRLPVAPATRIWSTSELARYLPGVIWQVAGRVYLVKPYGVRGSHCSASQILELVIFLLANLLVAVACLVWLGIKQMHGPAERWLYVAMALVPVLILLLHPRVLYRLMNGTLRRLNKPSIKPRMGFRSMVGLLLWNVLGIIVQSLAIWLLVEEPLGGLQLSKWWVVAGAYCLAWCAGFLAFWAQGGLGVRELVFIGALGVALPPAVRDRFPDQEQLTGLIMFLSVLLRLWATAGEIILASVAYTIDWRGALRGGGAILTTSTPATTDSPSSGG